MSKPFKKAQQRMVVYPKDIEVLTGRSEATCRRLISDLRIALGKAPTAFVTVQEFCAYYDFDEQLVMEVINR